jgi:hypothetical protein
MPKKQRRAERARRQVLSLALEELKPSPIQRYVLRSQQNVSRRSRGYPLSSDHAETLFTEISIVPCERKRLKVRFHVNDPEGARLEAEAETRV